MDPSSSAVVATMPPTPSPASLSPPPPPPSSWPPQPQSSLSPLPFPPHSPSSHSSPLPPATVPVVLSALQSCSHPDPSIRTPAERALSEWEESDEAGYVTSLLTIVSDVSSVPVHIRLLGAILVKNAVPNVWSRSRADEEGEGKNEGDAEGAGGEENDGEDLEVDEEDGNDDDKIDVEVVDEKDGDDGKSGGAVVSTAAAIAATADLENKKRSDRIAERSSARTALLSLLLSEPNDTIALHLRLSIANASLFDYPTRWPTLLSDLASVSESTDRPGPVRIRSAKTIRDVLRAIRHRKIIVKDMGGGGLGAGGLIRTLVSLRKLATDAMIERTKTREAVAPAFGPMGAKAWERASSFFTGGGGASGEWEIDGLLGAAYLKACGELLPMAAEVASSLSSGPSSASASASAEQFRSVVVDIGTFLGQASIFLQETGNLFLTPPSAIMAGIEGMGGDVATAAAAAAAERWAFLADKVYRSALSCCCAALSCAPILFAAHFPACLRSVVGSILALDGPALSRVPVKRLVAQTRFVKVALTCWRYFPKEGGGEAQKEGAGAAGGETKGRTPPAAIVLGPGCLALPSKANGGNDGVDDDDDRDDPAIVGAREAVSTMILGSEVRPRLVETLVTKFLRLTPAEIEEWDVDPEGRFQTDEAERTVLEPETPRHCGGIVLAHMMARDREGVADALLALAGTYQLAPPGDTDAMLNREACYHALEICRGGLLSDPRGKFRFVDWWRGELSVLLSASLGAGGTDGSAAPTTVAMRAMQARTVRVVHAFGPSVPVEDFPAAFRAVTALVAAPDLVTALHAARALHSLALLHVRHSGAGADGNGGGGGAGPMSAVRENSVPALGNAFALANRVSSDEGLKTSLMLVSGLVEANGTSIEHCLPAVAEQLPPLWDRAGDSVPIHSCLIAVLNHLIMKLGYPAVENVHVQRVLFPLLDYCTDIRVAHRAETLLEDGLKLWLVTLITSRLSTMSQPLMSMLPRLEAVLRSGLELHLSLKVLQFYSVLLGVGVVESVSEVLQGLLMHSISYTNTAAMSADDAPTEETEKMDEDENSAPNSSKQNAAGGGGATMKDAVGALNFMEALLQLSPSVGYAICSPALFETVRIMLRKTLPLPLVEAMYGTLARLLWIRPSALNEVLEDDPHRVEKIIALVRTWLQLLSRPVFLAMLDPTLETTMFIERKGAALSLCAVVCCVAEVASALGPSVIKFTEAVKRTEDVSKPNVAALVEAACGTARKVVGDGPLGDAAQRSADMLKADPLLTTSLEEALENARRAIDRAGSLSKPTP